MDNLKKQSLEVIKPTKPVAESEIDENAMDYQGIMMKDPGNLLGRFAVQWRVKGVMRNEIKIRFFSEIK